MVADADEARHAEIHPLCSHDDGKTKAPAFRGKGDTTGRWNNRCIGGIQTDGRIEVHQTKTVRSDQPDSVLTDFCAKLLFKRGSLSSGFGKSRGDENHGWHMLGGTVVDGGKDEMRRDGNDSQIDRV